MREEHCIQIDREQIAIVTLVLCGERIHGAVRPLKRRTARLDRERSKNKRSNRHGVHVRVERALDHVEKGVPHRVLFTATPVFKGRLSM